MEQKGKNQIEAANVCNHVAFSLFKRQQNYWFRNNVCTRCLVSLFLFLAVDGSNSHSRFPTSLVWQLIVSRFAVQVNCTQIASSGLFLRLSSKCKCWRWMHSFLKVIFDYYFSMQLFYQPGPGKQRRCRPLPRTGFKSSLQCLAAIIDWNSYMKRV